MSNHNRMPDMPDPKIRISSLVQRGNDLFVACRRDRIELEARGLEWKDVEELARLVQDCSSSEALWKLAGEKSAAETAKLEAFARECRQFRNSVVDKLRAAQQLLPAGFPAPQFKKSGGRAELVQDLHDLHVLCRIYNVQLKKASFDLELGQKAYEESRKLSLMCAQTVLLREDLNESKYKRNALCNRMYSIIKDICALGRSVFAKDPRIQDYYSGKPRSKSQKA